MTHCHDQYGTCEDDNCRCDDEREIKSITDGIYTLRHSWYLDDLGFKRNSFEIIRQGNNDAKISATFLGDIRVNNFTGDSVYGGDDVSPYTDEQYTKMFNEQVEKLKDLLTNPQGE